MDLRNLEGVINDVFLICSAASERQVESISDNIRSELKKQGIIPNHVEGTQLNLWVLIDCGDIIVHVFVDRVRHFYRLENLWHNAGRIPLQ